MDAHDAVQDAEAEMTRTFQELKAQITTVNALKDALMRPHRCWASRLSWGVAICLMIYLIVMHSFTETDKTSQIAALRVSLVTLTTQVNGQEARLGTVEHRLTQAVLVVEEAKTEKGKKSWWKRP